MSKHLLKHVVTGTKSTDGYAMIDPKGEGVQELLDAGHIEVNTKFANEKGEIAARATATGVSAYEADPIVEETKPEVVKPTFALLGGLEIPKIVRDNSHLKPREEVYPFSKLNVGESFFIAATEDKPNPAKTFAGTVSAAQRRFKEDDKFTKRFVIRAVEAGYEYSNGYKEPASGARVFRTE